MEAYLDCCWQVAYGSINVMVLADVDRIDDRRNEEDSFFCALAHSTLSILLLASTNA